MAQEDRRHDFARSCTHAAEIVSGIGESQLKDPTPCPDFDVAGLVDHIVGAARRAAEMGRGVSPSPEEFPHVDLADAPDLLRQAGKDAEEAWADDDRLEATLTMPWGETYTGHTVVNMYLAELAAHTWDLASATGQLGRLEADLAPSALAGARAMLKPEYRNLAGKGSPFGDEVQAPSGASDWEKFAAFMGRDPRN